MCDLFYKCPHASHESGNISHVSFFTPPVREGVIGGSNIANMMIVNISNSTVGLKFYPIVMLLIGTTLSLSSLTMILLQNLKMKG